MTEPGVVSRLVVLSGPLKGRRYDTDLVDEIQIGSDASCQFHLDVPGISPIHARVWVDKETAVVHETHSPQGVWVNDDRVAGQRPLNYGDVLWLGSPGEAESVMIQCLIKRPLPEEAAAAVEVEAALGGVEETVMIRAPRFTEEPPAVVEPPPVAAEPEPAAVEPEPHAPAVEPEPELQATMAHEVLEVAEVEAPAAVETVEPVHDDTSRTAIIEPEVTAESETVILRAPGPEPAAPPPPPVAYGARQEPDEKDVLSRFTPVVIAPPPAPVSFEDELSAAAPMAEPEPEPTIMIAPEPTVAMPIDFEDTVIEEAPTSATVIVPPPAAAPPPKPPAPSPVAAPPPAPKAAAPRPAAPKPPAAKAPAPARAAAPRPATPRPAAAPRTPPAPRVPAPAAPPPVAPVEAAAPAAEAPPPSGKSKAPLLAAAAIGVVVLGAAVVGGVLWMRRSTPEPPPTVASLPAQPVPTTLPQVQPSAEAPTPEPTPPVQEETTVVTTPPSTVPGVKPPSSTMVAAGPAVTQPKAATPPPTTVPAGPNPAQQVGALLTDADAAFGAKNYAAADAAYAAALKIDPQNAQALDGRNRVAAAQKAAVPVGHRFEVGRTAVTGQSKGKGGPAGFDTSGVSVMGDFSGDLEIEATPANPQPGQPFSLKISAVNSGKKDIKIASLTVTITADGNQSGGPRTAKVQKIDSKARAVVDEFSGTLPEGVKTWSASVVLKTDKGESLSNRVSLR